MYMVIPGDCHLKCMCTYPPAKRFGDGWKLRDSTYVTGMYGHVTHKLVCSMDIAQLQSFSSENKGRAVDFGL